MLQDGESHLVNCGRSGSTIGFQHGNYNHFTRIRNETKNIYYTCCETIHRGRSWDDAPPRPSSGNGKIASGQVPLAGQEENHLINEIVCGFLKVMRETGKGESLC
jgi:hypothetical protein